MEYLGVGEYINYLTSEQKKEYKKLIKQCLQDEKQLKKISKQSLKDIALLAKSTKKFQRDLSILVENTFIQKELPPEKLEKLREDYLRKIILEDPIFH